MQQSKKMTRQDKIIKTASALFSERGYSAVSMRDLAEAIGIKAASIYNHVSSKQEILSLIIIRTAEEFTEGMKVIAASKNSALEKMKSIIEMHTRITLNNTHALATLNQDWIHLVEPDLSYFKDMRKGYEQNIRKIIKKGVKNKEFKKLDIEAMLFSTLSTLRSLYLWYPETNKKQEKKLIEQLQRLLIEGIGK